jgi:hypothetical protein
MAKKAVNKPISSMKINDLIELIDDQIYKHLPIDKLTDIVKKKIEEYLPKEALKKGIRYDKPSNARR